MKKLKVYLDTSVISYLDASDAPDKMQDTLLFWDELILGKYDVYLSAVTLEEAFECAEPKLGLLKEKLSQIDYTFIEINSEIEQLAQKIIETGILKPKNIDDCLHIASAVVSECSYLLSWNFKHLVNIKIINGIRAISNITGYRPIDIVTPTIFIGGNGYD